jgi:hypothetical protein
VNRVREYHAHELGRGSRKIFVDFDNAEIDLNEESRQSAAAIRRSVKEELRARRDRMRVCS